MLIRIWNSSIELLKAMPQTLIAAIDNLLGKMAAEGPPKFIALP